VHDNFGGHHFGGLIDMFAQAPIGLCCFDSALRFIFINDHLAAINGIPAGEHLGRLIGEVIPDIAAGVEEQLHQVLETGEPIIGGVVDAETPAHSGRIRSFQHHYYALKSEAGTVSRVACVVKEVTAEKRAEEDLRMSEERFRDFSELGSDWLWEMDENLRFIYISPDISRLGVEIETFIGKTLEEARHDDCDLSDLDEEMQALNARKPYRLQRPSISRSDRWLHISGKPLFSKSGTFLGYRGATTDITERKCAEAALQKARDELETRVVERTAELRETNETLRNEIAEREMAVGALHSLSARLISAQEDERSRIARELHDDFNQRLALLALDLERFHDGLPKTQENLVDGLATLLRRTKELSSDVHRLSHQLHPSILDHLGLVAAARSFCKEISEQHDIHIELAHHEVPRSLPNDIALCLYRIVQEALRNVIKHSGAKSARIEITKMESELSLHISDNGIGFDPESDRTRHGLGLLSMRERLRQVDGTISFMRIEPTGTRIDVRIPISDSSQP